MSLVLRTTTGTLGLRHGGRRSNALNPDGFQVVAPIQTDGGTQRADGFFHFDGIKGTLGFDLAPGKYDIRVESMSDLAGLSGQVYTFGASPVAALNIVANVRRYRTEGNPGFGWTVSSSALANTLSRQEFVVPPNSGRTARLDITNPIHTLNWENVEDWAGDSALLLTTLGMMGAEPIEIDNGTGQYGEAYFVTIGKLSAMAASGFDEIGAVTWDEYHQTLLRSATYGTLILGEQNFIDRTLWKGSPSKPTFDGLGSRTNFTHSGRAHMSNLSVGWPAGKFPAPTTLKSYSGPYGIPQIANAAQLDSSFFSYDGKDYNSLTGRRLAAVYGHGSPYEGAVYREMCRQFLTTSLSTPVATCALKLSTPLPGDKVRILFREVTP